MHGVSLEQQVPSAVEPSLRSLVALYQSHFSTSAHTWQESLKAEDLHRVLRSLDLGEHSGTCDIFMYQLKDSTPGGIPSISLLFSLFKHVTLT